MIKPKQKRRPDGWVPVRLCARLMGVSRQGFNASYRHLVPPDAVRGNVPHVEIYARALVDVLIERETAALVGVDPELLCGPPDSPSRGLTP